MLLALEDAGGSEKMVVNSHAVLFKMEDFGCLRDTPRLLSFCPVGGLNQCSFEG